METQFLGVADTLLNGQKSMPVWMKMSDFTGHRPLRLIIKQFHLFSRYISKMEWCLKIGMSWFIGNFFWYIK